MATNCPSHCRIPPGLRRIALVLLSDGQGFSFRYCSDEIADTSAPVSILNGTSQPPNLSVVIHGGSFLPFEHNVPMKCSSIFSSSWLA